MIEGVFYVKDITPYSKNIHKILIKREKDKIIVERGDRDPKEKCEIDLKHGIASGAPLVRTLAEIGLPQETHTLLKKVIRREYVEDNTKAILELSYYNYDLNIIAPIHKIIPLDPNYYYFLEQFRKGENMLSLSVKPETALRIVGYFEEENGKITELVKAIALGDLTFLKVKDKLSLLKNKIDNLLNLLLNEDVNLFSHKYIFKLDDSYVITTNCQTTWYLVRDNRILQNGRKRLSKTKIKKLIRDLEYRFVWSAKSSFASQRFKEILQVFTT